MNPAASTVDLDRLMRLRLVVARFGEMDLAKWWNTKGQLGKLGKPALQRGFPRTHYFAQARSVFTVAAHRCAEVFDPPGSVTLWTLPVAFEEEFDLRWEAWLDSAAEWAPFFEALAELKSEDLVSTLYHLGLLSDPHAESYAKLRRSAEGRAVPLPGSFAGTDEDVTLLALGFGRGEPGALAVPYIKTADG